MRKLFLSVLFLMFLASNAHADITSNLMMWWPLNESTGTKGYDATAGQRTMTLANAPTHVAGQVGIYSTNFNGSNQEGTYVGSFTTSATMTYSTWVYFNVLGSGSTENSMMMENDNDNSDWGLALEMQGTNVRINSTGVTGGTVSVVSSNTLAINGWHMLTGTISNGTLNLYVDGVNKGTGSNTNAVIRGAGTHFTLAQLGETSGRNLNGRLNDSRVYIRALTLSDIQQLYQNGLQSHFGIMSGNSSISGKAIHN